MALTADRVIVQLEAKVDAYNRNVNAAQQNFDRRMRAIEGSSRRMQRTVQGSFGRLGGALGGIVSTAAAIDLIDSFTRIENSLKVAGLEGEGLAAVFERLSTVAQKNGAPVEALAQLYGRVALVQGELNVSTEELLRLTEGVAAALRVSGKSAAESSGALLQLSQALGGGVVRAEEFNAILEGAPAIALAAARGLEEAGGSVAKLRALVIDGKVSSEAFFRAFEAGQGTLEALASTTELTIGQAFENLRTRLITTAGRLNAMVGATELVADAIGDVGDAVESIVDLVEGFGRFVDHVQRLSGVDLGPVGDLISSYQDFESKVFRIGKKVLTFEYDDGGFDELQRDLNSTSAEITAFESAAEELAKTGDLVAGPKLDQDADKAAFQAEAIAARINKAFKSIGEAEQTGKVKPVSLSDFKPPDSGDPPKTRRTPAGDFAKDIAAIRERTAALQIEAQMVGKSTFERERALAALDLENQARRAGLALTPQTIAQINQEATALANATVNLEAMEAAQQRVADSMDAVRDAAGGALSAFNQALRDGEGAAGALNAALQRILDTVIRIAEEQAIAALFGAPGGAGGGAFGSIIGKFFGGATTAPPSFSVPSVASARAPAQSASGARVEVAVMAGEMFDARVIRTSGAVTATAIRSNNQKIPGMLAAAQARGVGI